jgi:hypothetical protein
MSRSVKLNTDDLRELQARSQEADRIGDEREQGDSNGPRSPQRELVARQ